MIGRKGKGIAKIVNIPPMKLSDYGKLPHHKLKLLKFKLRGLEEVRAGSFLQYNLSLNENIITTFVDYHKNECFVVVKQEEDKESIRKLIHGINTYTASPDLTYEAIFEEEEEVDYSDILKHRFNLEFLD